MVWAGCCDGGAVGGVAGGSLLVGGVKMSRAKRAMRESVVERRRVVRSRRGMERDGEGWKGMEGWIVGGRWE